MSKSHKSPADRQTITYAVGGRFAKLANPESKKAPPRDLHRGYIGPFTKKSRSRLIQSVNQTNAHKLPPRCTLVTLTYPGVFSSDPAVWKRDLAAWLQRLKRKYPASFGVWRLEPQKRGAPHYHLLVWSWVVIDKHWLSSSWYEVVGSGDPKHLLAGTNRENLRSFDRVAKYTSKYVAKLPEGVIWERPGRWWAWFNVAKKPVDLWNVHISETEFYKVRRLMRRSLGAKHGYHLAGGTRSGCWVAWSESTTSDVLRWLGYQLPEPAD